LLLQAFLGAQVKLQRLLLPAPQVGAIDIE
jgi:hypothetical protein